MYISNILLYRISPGYLNLKLKLLPEQIQNSGTLGTRVILRTMSIYPVKI